MKMQTWKSDFKSSNSSSMMPSWSWSTLQMYSAISRFSLKVTFTCGSSSCGRPGCVGPLAVLHSCNQSKR